MKKLFIIFFTPIIFSGSALFGKSQGESIIFTIDNTKPPGISTHDSGNIHISLREAATVTSPTTYKKAKNALYTPVGFKAMTAPGTGYTPANFLTIKSTYATDGTGDSIAHSLTNLLNNLFGKTIVPAQIPHWSKIIDATSENTMKGASFMRLEDHFSGNVTDVEKWLTGIITPIYLSYGFTHVVNDPPTRYVYQLTHSDKIK